MTRWEAVDLARNPVLSLLALAAAAFVWASHNIAGAWLTYDLHPVLANLIRTTLASLFYVPILLYYRGRVHLERRHRVRVFAAAVCLGTFFQLFYVALWLTSASHVAILLALGPAVTAGLAIPYLGERMRVRAQFGLATALGSALILGFVQVQSAGGDTPWIGAAAAFIAMVAFAHYTLLSKPLLTCYPVAFVLGYTIATGTVLLWAVVPVLNVEWAAVGTLTLPQWMTFTYIALFMNVLSYIFYNQALRHLPAGATHAIVVYVTTIFALIMARTVLNEAVPLTHWVCAASVALGVWLTASPSPGSTAPETVPTRPQ